MGIHILCRRVHDLPRLTLYLLVLMMLSMPGLSQTAPVAESEGGLIVNPGSDLWRAVRQRNTSIEGTSQIKNVDSGVLINPQADKWTNFRVDNLVYIGYIIFSVMILLLLVFFSIRGKIRLEGGFSGKMVLRFSDFQRVSHWILAIVFLYLAATGLALLFGRTLLIPVLGHELFSIIASASKESHNLFGPIFAASLLLMISGFIKRNLYEKGDLTWLLKGGGMFGKEHVSTGFFNMGEKFWYWIVIIVGLIISVSGLILVSPNFGQGRIIMELSHVVHSISALVMIAISFGHIYLASYGVDGVKEGMKTGYVDIKWAEAHHDRWAKECHENDQVLSIQDSARLQGVMEETK